MNPNSEVVAGVPPAVKPWRLARRRCARIAIGLWRRVCAALFLFIFLHSESAFGHGELLIQIGKVTERINAATNNFAPLYLERAELHRQHEDWEAAKADYDVAEQLDPNLPGLDLCRAKMLDDSGQLQAAKELFTEITARSPDDGEAWIGRARVLAKLDDKPSAIADYRRGLQLVTSPPPEYFLEFAQILSANGNTNEALEILDRGITRAGPTVPLQGYALELERARGNHEAALTRVDTLIARASRKEELFTQRGEILLAANRPTQAIESFQSAIAAIRKLPTLLQNAPPMQKLLARIQSGIEAAEEGQDAGESKP